MTKPLFDVLCLDDENPQNIGKAFDKITGEEFECNSSALKKISTKFMEKGQVLYK